MKKLNIKYRRMMGQSTIELTALLIIIIGALLVIQVYFKRGIQGRWKTAVDELATEMYDPYLTNSEITYRTASNAVVDIRTIEDGAGRWTMRTDSTNLIDSREGHLTIGGYD